MPDAKAALPSLVELRRDAENRLRDGSAPPSAGWSVGVNALGMLHDLASRPESAIDALKLLHELQVYQVELDLQHEQIESSHRDLVDDLTRYRALYECAPVAYLNVSLQRDILECNIAGARLFDSEEDALRGRSLDTLVAPANRPALLQLLNRLRADGISGSCEVQLSTGYGSHKMQVIASSAVGGQSFMVAFVDLPARR
jgi:PAS domain S-box-containing protein